MAKQPVVFLFLIKITVYRQGDFSDCLRWQGSAWQRALYLCLAVVVISNAKKFTFTNVIKTHVNPTRISEGHHNLAAPLLW